MMWLFLVTMANAGYGQESGTARGNSQWSCQQIAVLGAVRNPANLKAEPRRRIFELLALAGGPTAAAGKVVRLVHTCQCSPCTEIEKKTEGIHEYNLLNVLRGLKSENPYVVRGDIVIVLEADSVFIIGNVRTPRSIHFSEGMTVTKAIAIAGGAVRSSRLVTIRIHRNGSYWTARDPIVVDLKAVLDGHAENVLLQPWNIVEVSDELGHFRRLRPTTPIWDPPLKPRKEDTGPVKTAVIRLGIHKECFKSWRDSVS
jgi:protein involved in polysaccharide export with SLBB domain